MYTNRYAQILYYAVASLFVVSGVALGAFYFIHGIKPPLYMGLATPLFLLIPAIFRRMKIMVPYRLLIFLFIYLILGYNVGFIMDGYKKFILYYFDKSVHFLSGFLFTIIGFCIFFFCIQTLKKNRILGLFYALFFSMFVAFTFEFVEYIVFLTTKSDPQLTLTTGVADTMEDLAACLYGSVITVVLYALKCRKNFQAKRKTILQEFCELNDIT